MVLFHVSALSLQKNVLASIPSFSAVAVNESDHIWKIVADDMYMIYAIFLPATGDSVLLSVVSSSAAASLANTGTAETTIAAESNAAINFFFMIFLLFRYFAEAFLFL